MKTVVSPLPEAAAPVHSVVEVPAVAGTSGGGRTGELIARWGLLLAFVALIVFFSVLRPDTFATWDNARNILNSSSILMLFGCIVTSTMLLGEFDISFPYVADLATVSIAVLVTTNGLDTSPQVALAVLVVIAAMTAVGSVTGALVASGRAPSFVITLAIGSVVAGFELTMANRLPNGQTQVSSLNLPSPLRTLGTTDLFGSGIRVSVLLALVVAAAAWFVLRQTVSGRRIHAIGGNAKAAELAGVPLRRLRFAVFAVAGGLAAVAGLISAAERGYVPSASTSLLLPSYTAAFLGVTLLSLRRFNVPGTIVSILFLQTLSTGLSLLDQERWVVSVVTGLVLLTAVLATNRKQR